MSTKEKNCDHIDLPLPKVNKNRLGLFKIKPIVLFRVSDDQFQFVMKLGEKVKHLQPLPPEVLQKAENDRVFYKRKLLDMKILTLDTTVKDMD